MTAKARVPGVRAAILAAFGAAAMMFPVASHAQANTSKPYGCSCLTNSKVNGTINYRYKWGNKEWHNKSIDKGKWQTVCWAYKDAPKSPDLTFELDTDMTSGKSWKSFSLTRGQSSSMECSDVPGAAQYHIGYVADSGQKRIRIFPGK